MSDRPVVELFYCASCPSSYLAFVRLQEVASRTGARLACRPVVSAWLPPAGPAPRHGDNPRDAAARYARKDLQDWARFCGVPLELPQPPAMDAEWVQRGAIVALAAGRGRPWIEAAFEARFALGLDLSRHAAVLELAGRWGLGGEAFAAALDADATREALTENGEELLRRGGFATPAMFLDDDLFFGHERVSLLEWALMRRGERPFIAPGEHGR